METFDKEEIRKLYKPTRNSGGEKNGQVTIIGGSKLFHGAPLLSLKVASRMVDMVFFSSPDPSVGRVAEKIKSKLFSFIWVPWDEVEVYIEKSDACLIGPGFMRYGEEAKGLKLKAKSYDEEGEKTRKITERFLKKFSEKRWVIDAGSLQVMDAEWIPENAILTPNKREFEMLFGSKLSDKDSVNGNLVFLKAKENKCTIVAKGKTTVVCDSNKCVKMTGGNLGLTKGGMGDVLAGFTVALLSKNDPFLAACSAAYVSRFAADELYKKLGPNYNADDLADKIPEVLNEIVNS